MNYFKEINNFNYIFLLNLIDNDEKLYIRICGSKKINTVITENTISNEILKNSHEIVADDSVIYEIILENHIGYSVRNESYAQNGYNEKYTGNLFRVYSESDYLDYLKKSTFAEQLVSYMHYEIVCVNQVIDIATDEEPLIIKKINQ